MGFGMLFMLALGLSMDAFAVSLSNGMCYREIGRKQGLTIAMVFGLFQALMPVIGFFVGQTFSEAISFLDHWIALTLLGFVGGNMIVESVKELRHPRQECMGDTLGGRDILIQGIATSIDALAVGIGFAVMQINIAVAASFIGVITFVCCAIGVKLGKGLGVFLKQKAEIAGGIILIGIGVKIFVEHMW